METIPNWNELSPTNAALHYLQMDGVFYTQCALSAPWGLQIPAIPDCLLFHFITNGTCLIEVDERETYRLEPGDLVLLPTGEGHVMRSSKAVAPAPLLSLQRLSIGNRFEMLRHGGGGVETEMICGAVRFSHPASKNLFACLPALLLTRASDPNSKWAIGLIQMMLEEANQIQIGSEAVISRLADVLIIRAVRNWLATLGDTPAGWLTALNDQKIGKAIALIHKDPAHPWTLASLANAVGMSRSAFSARFTAILGESAMSYIARWRMVSAHSILREKQVPIVEVASKFGYQSEAAFSRKFKSVNGFSPRETRRKTKVMPSQN